MGEKCQSHVSTLFPISPYPAPQGGNRYVDVKVFQTLRFLLPCGHLELLLIEKSPFLWVLERTYILFVSNINLWGFLDFLTNLSKSIKYFLGSFQYFWEDKTNLQGPEVRARQRQWDDNWATVWKVIANLLNKMIPVPHPPELTDEPGLVSLSPESIRPRTMPDT